MTEKGVLAEAEEVVVLVKFSEHFQYLNFAQGQEFYQHKLLPVAPDYNSANE